MQIGRGEDRLEERARHRADRPLDQRRPVVDRDDPHPGGRPGWISWILARSRRVTSSGFSPWRISTTPPVASVPSFSSTPRRGALPSETLATSASGTGRAVGGGEGDVLQVADHPLRLEAGVRLARPGARASRRRGRRTRRSPCGRRFRRPRRWPAGPPRPPARARSPCVRSRCGSSSTWYSSGNPPTLATSATPGTAASCGRTYQSWIARSRPGSYPFPSTVYQKIWPVAAASGASRGVAPAGHRSRRTGRARRSTCCRAALPADAVLEDHADHREADVARRPHHPDAVEALRAPERAGR